MIRQAEIWWVAIPPAPGHKQAGDRPALVIQSNVFIRRLATVPVVPFTSNVAATRFPGTLLLQPDEKNGLSAPSVALVCQMQVVDQRDLMRRIGEIESEQFTEILALVR